MSDNVSIVVKVHSIDGFRASRTFKTEKFAARFAQKYVGKSPEISVTFGYAVSGDGVCKVEVQGISLEKLFPSQETPAKQEDDDW